MLSDSAVDALVNSLEANANHITEPMERRTVDTLIWYHKNRRAIPKENLKARVDLMDDAVWIMLEIMALQLERIQKLEQTRGQSQLFIPGRLPAYGA